MKPEVTKIDARTLLLDLVVTGQPPVYPAQNLVKAGQAFGIGPSAMRAALSRLTREGKIDIVGRGLYGIGEGARPLQRQLRAWETQAKPPKVWNGGWLLAIAGPGDRENRTVWRRTRRMLRLRGFAEAEANVWARPDNMTGSVEQLRSLIKQTGGAPSLLVIRCSDLDQARQEAWRGLWDVAQMQRVYQAMHECLVESAAGLDGKSLAEAAAETLTLGRACIRILNLDPSLPEEFCPSAHRRALARTMIAYNRKGTATWFRFLGLD
jgi:phenylacetic acid degradation operon negative regulatory protein